MIGEKGFYVKVSCTEWMYGQIQSWSMMITLRERFGQYMSLKPEEDKALVEGWKGEWRDYLYRGVIVNPRVQLQALLHIKAGLFSACVTVHCEGY